ncbi:hypothetical protein EYF80_004740 [Liparis tanakae]|uniref:Uncharacterized protein n=1 Tax=Liparis tanakae TaxID=230148 RepID=A0A4Z2J4H4_9TELE|nr:hypothetical protein EYF80_004740 [Liparis tanakae]
MAEVFLAASFRMWPSLMNSLEGLTMSSSSPSISVVLRQLLQIVFQQHLVARDSLHGLQHVVLERQAAADLLALSAGTTHTTSYHPAVRQFHRPHHSPMRFSRSGSRNWL